MLPRLEPSGRGGIIGSFGRLSRAAAVRAVARLHRARILVLAGALVVLFALRRGVVLALLSAAAECAG